MALWSWVFQLLALGAFADGGAAPTRYDVSSLVRSSDGLVELVGGRAVRLPVTWRQRRILFEDLHPGANWGHAARFLLTRPDGTVEGTLATELPPIGLHECPIVSGTNPRPKRPVQFALSNHKGLHKVADPARHWALLINGYAEQRHWNDFSFLYRVLVEIYGYLPSQILVLDSVYQNRTPDLDDNGTPDIQYGSTEAEVLRAFATLNQGVKKTDRLLVVVNDHGIRVDDESALVLIDSEMKASRFAALLKQVPADEVISVFEQCDGGGFVRPTVGPGRVSLAASLDTELSWATVDFIFDEFLYHFISALAFQRHDGTPVTADGNGDGRISVKEAFTFALDRDKAPESPFLESAVNTGKAMEFGVGY